MVEATIELVDSFGAKSVADLGAIKGNAHHRGRAAVGIDSAMIGDVAQALQPDFAPARRIESI